MVSPNTPQPTRALALELYQRHLAGETAEQLAADTGIPLDRIQVRLIAAEAYHERRRNSESQHKSALVH